MKPNVIDGIVTPSRVRAAMMRSAASVLLLSTLMHAPAAWAGEVVDETRPLAPNGHVLIENKAGEISVTGWERNEVRITGELSDDVKELEIRETENGIRIRVEYDESWSIDGSDIDVMVPLGASVEAETVSADISVEKVSGEALGLRTVSGDIDVTATPRKLSLTSVSGDIDFAGQASRAGVETVSGEVSLEGVSGEVEVTTVSGDVIIEGDILQTGQFEAVSGDVEITAALGAGGRINVSSMSGDIDLRLPDDQQAEFSAQTFSGDIRSDFGKSTRPSRGPGSRLEHREGNSGSSIKLNTFSGDIIIRRR